MYPLTTPSADPAASGLPAGAARHLPPDGGASGAIEAASDPARLAHAVRDASMSIGFDLV